MSKRRISKGAFLGIWCSVAGICLASAIALEVFGDNSSFHTLFDTTFGRGNSHVVQADGSQYWDTDYYRQSFPQAKNTTASPLAKRNALEVSKKIEDEGIVLLKNENCLPLAQGTGITILGKGSVDPAFAITHYETSITEDFVMPADALASSGFRIDETAKTFFTKNMRVYPQFRVVPNNYEQTTFFIGEIPVEKYDFPVLEENVGVVFITRFGGDGVDLSTNLLRDTENAGSLGSIGENINAREEHSRYVTGQHQLELSAEEKDMITWSSSHYKKTVVVLNSAFPMEIGSLKDSGGVDAILQVGLPGECGFSSLGRVFAGVTNPSGKTPDIYPRDFRLDPTFPNFGFEGNPKYANLIPFSIDHGDMGADSFFVQYEEGIYSGYRYYETRGAIEGEAWYQDAVAYPFGHGLSYTRFEKSLKRHRLDGDTYRVEVEVKNVGAVPGKETVQLYGRPPYESSQAERSEKTLLAFGKTALLSPMESEVVSLQFSLEDIAYYDSLHEKAWVLDAGNYAFFIQENSHEVSKDAAENPLFFEVALDKRQVLEKKKDDSSANGNLFEDVEEMFDNDAEKGHTSLLSRSDFAATFPTRSTALEARADAVVIQGKTIAEWLRRYTYVASEAVFPMPTIGAENNVLVSSLRGADYFDAAYDRLLDQLTEEDYMNAVSYICNNAFAIKGIDSIGLSDADIRGGSQGFFSETLTENVCLYPCQSVLSSTFNVSLATEMGNALGEEALAFHHRCLGWYGPSLDVHRSPFAGRYADSFSEDPLLTGEFGAAIVSATMEKGLVSFVQHFGLHQQESFKNSHLCVWANEQAIREIYLRPFEIVVKKAKASLSYTGLAGAVHHRTMRACTGILSSSIYLGARWSGGRKDLLSTLLKKQWGFQGVISSDINQVSYMNPMQALLAGTDIENALASFKDHTLVDLKNPTIRWEVRRAIKNVAYLSANSNAMQYVAPGSRLEYDISPWRVFFYIGEVVFFLSSAASIAWIIVRMRRVKKESEFE